MFTAPEGGEVRTMSPDVPQLNELIYRFLVQPIHAGSSQGYGSLGSSGSHEHQQGATSSSESNGHASEDQMKPRKPVRMFIIINPDIHVTAFNITSIHYSSQGWGLYNFYDVFESNLL